MRTAVFYFFFGKCIVAVAMDYRTYMSQSKEGYAIAYNKLTFPLGKVAPAIAGDG